MLLKVFSDPYFYLTLLGICLAVFSIYLALRKRRPGELTYVEEGAISLLSDVAASIENLDVKYRGLSINANLGLLKAHLINTGTKDITPDMVGSPLEICLPQNSRWIEANTSDCSQGVKASCRVVDQSLVFDLGMIRVGEAVGFEAVIELPTGNVVKDFKKHVKFEHRIADVGSIRTEVLPSEDCRKFKWLITQEAVFQFVFMVVLLVSVFIFTEKFFGKNHELVYHFQEKGEIVSSRVKVLNKPDLVEIKTIDGLGEWKESASGFFGRNDLKVESVEKSKSSYLYVIYGFFIVAYLALAIGDIRKYVRAKRLYNTLNDN